MKVLLHITSNGEYVIGDDRTGLVKKLTKKELMSGQKFNIKYMKADSFKVRVDSLLESKFKSNAVAVLAALAESKKIFGYMLYVPVEGRLMCVGGDRAADLASQYGIVYGRIKNTPSNKKRYIEGTFSIQQGYHHKQVYMDLYRERRERAIRAGRPAEKIVRPDTQSVEMRYLPPFIFDTYKEPRGVNVFNFKWYKLIENELTLLKRPQVKNLDISTYCEKILYKGVGEEYEKALLDSNCSLGCFAHWNIDTLQLGPMLQEIGKEAFYDNNLLELVVPKKVSNIGESAFMNNMLKRVYFCKGEDLSIQAYAFANNNLTEICIPSNIVSLGEYCFSGNLGLNSIRFDTDARVEEFKDGVFMDCGIESLTIPASVKKVSDKAFYGCDNLKTVIIVKGGHLDTDEFKSSMKKLGIEVLYL